MRTNDCCHSRSTVELVLAVAIVVAVAAAGCRTTPFGGGDVRIAGSDTMLPLNRRLAEAYMRDHPGVAVRVTGGGTGEGVRRLLESQADLCAASRPFRPDEIEALNRTFGTIGLRFLVARDALSVYVHPANPIRSLTLDQLGLLFAGRVARWSELGGPDLPVAVVIRPPTSGTHHFFRDHVLGDAAYSEDAEVVPRVGDVIARVASDPRAVGYGDLAHDGEVVDLRVDGVQGAVETVRSGAYPLARYLSFYAVAPPDGVVRNFVEWCVGPEGQRVVDEVGFIALWSDE
jgi:phosphate transport system substrate-binding protein